MHAACRFQRHAVIMQLLQSIQWADVDPGGGGGSRPPWKYLGGGGKHIIPPPPPIISTTWKINI